MQGRGRSAPTESASRWSHPGRALERMHACVPLGRCILNRRHQCMQAHRLHRAVLTSMQPASSLAACMSPSDPRVPQPLSSLTPCPLLLLQVPHFNRMCTCATRGCGGRRPGSPHPSPPRAAATLMHGHPRRVGMYILSARRSMVMQPSLSIGTLRLAPLAAPVCASAGGLASHMGLWGPPYPNLRSNEAIHYLNPK